MLAVGVDIIEVARIQRSVDRHGVRFLNRIFTTQEQAYCVGRADRLAARFAVKEAVGKAFGTGIGDVSWKEIEVVNDERGRPELVLHDSAAILARELDLHRWSISMSHTDTHAIGMVVALGRG
jgi:holo-[acyl-carrier protein] synthase